MESVGAEVGQKMRSAIKAKLLELDCYVDDELPDYIMVMVANRRSKIQMNEDLNLFLNTKTSAFVDWLHIVLKKLKEVTVTNPEVYKQVSKRKYTEQEDGIKKEKKSKKLHVRIKTESEGSLTDDLPITTHKLNEDRKNIFKDETRKRQNQSNEFDIPLLSEVDLSTEKDLEEIERKIRSVKSRLGSLVDSDVEAASTILEKEECKANIHSENLYKVPEAEIQHFNINLSDREVELQEEPQSSLSNQSSFTPERQRKHSPITFDRKDIEDKYASPKKVSILKRLGKRISSSDYRKKEDRFNRFSSRDGSYDRDDQYSQPHKRDRNRLDEKKSKERLTKAKHDFAESPKQRSRTVQNMLSNIGVMSKIQVPEKNSEDTELEDELRTREVRSMVQVKPRVVSVGTAQPNKNLLLKAVAEAHRSVSQAANIKPSVSESNESEVPITRKLSHREKVKLRNMILAQVSREDSDSIDEDKEFEYVPKPLTKKDRTELPKYVPSSRQSIDESEPEEVSSKTRVSAKSRLEGRKSPSPITFDNVKSRVLNRLELPEKLPVIPPPIPSKNKERCKYWPQCRQGGNCEFVHPAFKCEKLPNCQYGDKCLFIHPVCKFGSACTKRDCCFSHFSKAVSVAKSPVTQTRACKFSHKCTNSTCSFYHPKECKFGKYCKNKIDCPFSHSVMKSSLTWRSSV